jgi:CBS domain-containing protein
MRVKEIMTRSPFCCTGANSVQSAAQMMKDKDVGCLPVLTSQEPQRLQGVVTDRDLCCAMLAGNGKDPSETRIEDVMTPNPATCRPDDTVEACALTMQQQQVRRIPVVDDQGRCVGIVAQADLALHADPKQVYRTLAEISKPLETNHQLKVALLNNE